MTIAQRRVEAAEDIICGPTVPHTIWLGAAALAGMPEQFDCWEAVDHWLHCNGYRPRHGGGYEAGGKPWIELVQSGDMLQAVNGGVR